MQSKGSPPEREGIEVGIRYLPNHDDLPRLERMTSGASGYDIFAACERGIVIEPGRAALVPGGFVLSIPQGCEAQIRPRSGLALNERVGILNSPGTIDSDYRGEVCVILFNFGDEDYTVNRGDRMAQLIFGCLPPVRLLESEELGQTERGSGGFGHTG